MPQASQERVQGAQSNQNLRRVQKGGSPGLGSGTVRSVVADRQTGQGGVVDGVIIMTEMLSHDHVGIGRNTGPLAGEGGDLGLEGRPHVLEGDAQTQALAVVPEPHDASPDFDEFSPFPGHFEPDRKGFHG